MPRRHWPPRETWYALKAGTLPDFIGRDAVCALTGWTCALLEARWRSGEFPRPQTFPATRAKERKLLWETTRVAAWLADQGIVEPPKSVAWRGRSGARYHERFTKADPSPVM